MRDTSTREARDLLSSVRGTSDSGLMTRTGSSSLGGMAAQIGADGLYLLGDPRPELLFEVARIQPQPGGEWVNLEKCLGFHSTRRLRIIDSAGGVGVETWPAELKPQACYLYGGGFGLPLVAAARERGWTVEPSPHIAHPRAPDRRLYMPLPSDKALAYVACWEDEDALSRVEATTPGGRRA